MLETFLLVLAALFPIVNPLGTALVFLSMTSRASLAERRSLSRRVAINSFCVMAGAFLLGALVLKFYGISIPVLRVAGGLIVAVAGWKLLNEGNRKEEDAAPAKGKVEYAGLAFYPLTLPLTTGPGTISVLISLGFSRGVSIDFSQDRRASSSPDWPRRSSWPSASMSASPSPTGLRSCSAAPAPTSPCGCRLSSCSASARRSCGAARASS